MTGATGPGRAATHAARPAAHPFDAAAPGYDDTFTRGRVARLLRESVRRRLECFPPGGRVLEIGCGTGEDAVWLALRGVHVVATDVSGAMLEATRRKARAAGVEDRVRTTYLDAARAESSEAFAAGGRYDGAFSNFGALNCVSDRRPLALALAEALRPGAQVVLVLMGPLCAWEILWHLARLRPSLAMRRLRSGVEARVAPAASVRVWYPPPGRLRAEFRSGFRVVGLAGLGVCVPPPALAGFVERRPRLLEALAGLDRCLEQVMPVNRLGDHYILTLERS